MQTGGTNEGRTRALYDSFNDADFDRLKEALMTSSSIEEVAEKAGRVGELHLELIDPEIELDFSSMPPFPEGNTFRGLQGWLEFWRTWLMPWKTFRYEVKGVRADGETVRVEAIQRGRVSEGPEYAMTFFGRFTFEGGKLIRVQFFLEREAADAAER